MKIPVHIKYSEPYLPTPRSRKYRSRAVEDTVEIELAEAKMADMTPAFEMETSSNDYEVVYFYNDVLYVPAPLRDFAWDGSGFTTALEGFMDQYTVFSRWYAGNMDNPRDRVIDKAQKQMKDFLLVDGVLFKVTGEPRYVIDHFGLGHNHGGTSLSVCTFDRGDYEAVYSALDGELAVKDAKEAALSCGDTESVPFIKERIKVLLPDAVKVPRKILTPFLALEKAKAEGRKIQITDEEYTFFVEYIQGCSMTPGNKGIDVVLENGLRMRLPLREDHRNSTSWSIRELEDGTIHIRISWDFLGKPLY